MGTIAAMMDMQVTPIPLLRDNYAWLLRAPDGERVAVVDPGEAAPVRRALQSEGLKLAAILITHHHGDHVGGLAELATPGVPVYGPATEAIRGVTHPVQGADRVSLEGFPGGFEVIDVPGHTAGHIAYHGDGTLLAGDSLFAGGCGRLFEGSPAQMLQSLARLRELPLQTRLYCGHEYTLANLEFASVVEPDNAALQERLERVRRLRDAGEITLPSTLAEERATNPFLRWDAESVIRSAEAWAGRPLDSADKVFATVRAWKDQF